MNFLDKQFGRMGNRMFQMAALIHYSKMVNSDIYFQDPSWFEGSERFVKQIFSQGIPPQTDRVSVHVRRGDYIVQDPAMADKKFYVELAKTNYYEKAMQSFRGERFLIFSDDIEWCKIYFDLKVCDFSEGKTEEEDLMLMASCKHNIIANSSFSYWAAYLNPNPDKIVIAPKAWYMDGVQRTKCPPEWIQI